MKQLIVKFRNGDYRQLRVADGVNPILVEMPDADSQIFVVQVENILPESVKGCIWQIFEEDHPIVQVDGEKIFINDENLVRVEERENITLKIRAIGENGRYKDWNLYPHQNTELFMLDKTGFEEEIRSIIVTVLNEKHSYQAYIYADGSGWYKSLKIAKIQLFDSGAMMAWRIQEDGILFYIRDFMLQYSPFCSPF